MNKLWVVVGNLSIGSLIGVVSWRGWQDGVEEVALIGGAMILVVLVAIYNTITGRD